MRSGHERKVSTLDDVSVTREDLELSRQLIKRQYERNMDSLDLEKDEKEDFIQDQ